MTRLYLPLLLLTLASCTRKLTYHIDMTHPVQAKDLSYENDTLSATFQFLSDAIVLELYNKLDDGLKINWDEVSMSVNGKAHRVVHKETGQFNITELQPPTTIPPRTKLVDMLIRADDVSYTYVRGVRKPYIKGARPSKAVNRKEANKIIDANKGQRITLFLPYYIRNQYCSSVFEFVISDVNLK